MTKAQHLLHSANKRETEEAEKRRRGREENEEEFVCGGGEKEIKKFCEKGWPMKQAQKE